MTVAQVPPPRWPRVARDVLLGVVAYFVAARIGLEFSLFEGSVSPVWPPSGVALGLALVFGRRVAFGAGLGALLSDVVTNGLTVLSPMVGVGALLSCWTGVTLLRKSGFDRKMPRVREVLLLVALGALASPVMAASFGSYALYLNGHVPREALGQVWRTWWVGDALGVLSFAPVLLAYAGTPRGVARITLRERAAVLALLVASTVGVFLLKEPVSIASGMLVFAAVPVMAIVWVALRFDQRTAATAMLFVSIAAILGTAAGRGAFSLDTPSDRIWLLQLYLVICALTTFTISSLIADSRARHLALKASEEQLRRTQQLAAVGGFSWRMGSAPRWSPQLHAIYQVPESEPPLTLDDARALMLPGDRVRYEALLTRIRPAPVPYTFSFSFRRRDGDIRHAQAMAEPLLDADGKLLGWDGAIQDITERVNTEEKLRTMERGLQQSQRLESLGLLAGGVAHDFNNLLTGILANAAYVKSAVKERPNLAQALGDVEGASRAASELCRQMLTFAGRARPSLERVELSNLVGETGQLLSRSIKRGARLVFDLASDLPAIDGDPTQLRQIAMNLLMNASDALGETGSVLIRTEVARCSAEDLTRALTQVDLAGKTCVRLTVEDDGCGMSEETLQRIFQPFFTTKAKGRGLGLAATLGIVQQHNGALVVTSELGKGTRFTLWFPVSDAAKVAVPHEVFHLQGTALVVDDEPAVLRAATRLLEAAGVTVLTALGVEEAQQQLGKPGSVSFALVDQQLGEGKGDALVRKLKAERPGLPCVIMISVPDEPAALALQKEGLAAVLLKPFRPETLREAVQQASRTATQAAPAAT
ncbi:MAG: MASE1 domain-containing protein [Deltaproteobacteria bacterium]|nr:MASE1 domain-containing protein [Deltaproteobacteria bacterium]